MNTILTYLRDQWHSLPLTQYVDPDRLSCVMMTPRFMTSSHVLFFILEDGHTAPVLVAKVPRLKGHHRQLERESNNLRAAQLLFSQGTESIPKVLAYDEYQGYQLLIESAVKGQPLRSGHLRHRFSETIEPVMEWLIDFHRVSARRKSEVEDWFERHVEQTFATLESVFSVHDKEYAWIEKTREVVAPLRDMNFPVVFEHGDFSSPNIMLGPGGEVGLVDWELAEQEGIPAADAFFFMFFAACCMSPRRLNGETQAIFHRTFYSEQTWTRKFLEAYCTGVELDRALLDPLFVLTWCRYVANLTVRLQSNKCSESRLGAESIAWLRDNRYYQFWKYSLERAAANPRKSSIRAIV